MKTEITQLKAEAQLVYDNTDTNWESEVWAALQFSIQQAQGVHDLYQYILEAVKSWGISEECFNKGLVRAKDNFLYCIKQGDLNFTVNGAISAVAGLLECTKC